MHHLLVLLALAFTAQAQLVEPPPGCSGGSNIKPDKNLERQQRVKIANMALLKAQSIFFRNLTSKEKDKTMAEKLQNHTQYWETIIGPIKTTRNDGDQVTMGEASVEAALKLIAVIENTRTVFLDRLIKNIRNVKYNIDGLSEKEKENMKNATEWLLIADNKAKNANNEMEVLALDTVNRVKQMLYYMTFVQDNWDRTHLTAYFKYQATLMTNLIERSLVMQKEADELYKSVQTDLSKIEARLLAFKDICENLADKKSEAWKKKEEEVRLAVYVPCAASVAIACIPCLATCVATVETTLAVLNHKVKELVGVMRGNVNTANALVMQTEDERDTLEGQIKSLLRWGSTLHEMSEWDYTFPQRDFMTWPAIKRDLQLQLNNLKNAAFNYLQKLAA
jgi:hypothetical protein